MSSRRRMMIASMLAAWVAVADFGAVPAAYGDVERDVLDAEAARVAVMAEARSKTVAIFPPEGNGGGSGVLISADGYALSNFHVVKGSEKFMKCGLSDGRSYDAVVVGIDPVGDVALIKIFGRDDFPHAEFGDSDAVRTGDWVFASGNPFLLAHDFKPTVTYGIVSGVHRYQYPSGTLLEYADCIQTDASINPGNSGGPLFDAQGKLIGINGRGSFEKRGRVNVGVGYAISINQIKHFLGCLKSGRIVDHATLGARTASDADGRVIVADILEDSDAWRRGLRIGDEITEFGGRQVRTVNAFKNILGIFPQGWRVPVTYRNKGTSHKTFIRLAGVHDIEDLIEKTMGKAEPEKGLPPGPPKPPEEPGPNDKPDEKKPKDGPEEQPKEGKSQEDHLPKKFKLPFQKSDAGEEIAVPEIVKKHYAEKRGFANYKFNEHERDRTWNALSRSMQPAASIGGTWTIEAEQISGGAAAAKSNLTITIGDALVEYRLPSGAATLPVGGSFAGAVDPQGTGGLLAALSLWRRLIVLGPTRFGDLRYEGAFSLPGLPDNYDVLLGRQAGVACRFFVDPRSGDLVSVEMQADDELDPCELFFADYREQKGRRLPTRIEIRHGDATYAVVVPREWKFSPEAAK
ncbi:MAG: trypsin-like peptidase domain-containing protein [Planctomycetia bacterium]|nr:trypsin-like peptidase domain-containing protein [Planctomycetia bacterium]